MSGSNGDWAALASQHERVILSADEQPQLVDISPARALSRRWDELASQSERLIDQTELPTGLVSSSHTGPGLRLAVSAA